MVKYNNGQGSQCQVVAASTNEGSKNNTMRDKNRMSLSHGENMQQNLTFLSDSENVTTKYNIVLIVKNRKYFLNLQ